MLGEARRRHDRGTDVVVGYVETHGREHTESMLEGLEVVPRRRSDHRGTAFTEMDTDAILAREPALSCWSTSSRTPTCPAAGTRSGPRTSSSCARPAST